MAEGFRPVAPVDPTNLRPMLFLDVARQIMLSEDWPYRAVTVVMRSVRRRRRSRGGSVKRVASAVGEGSVVISAVHSYLAGTRTS